MCVAVGRKLPGASSRASAQNASGRSLKYASSKTASGRGSEYFCRLSYSPVPGVRKSGMPALTEMPAPHMTTTPGARDRLGRSRFAMVEQRAHEVGAPHQARAVARERGPDDGVVARTARLARDGLADELGQPWQLEERLNVLVEHRARQPDGRRRAHAGAATSDRGS